MTKQMANNEKVTEIELVYRNPRDPSEQPSITSSELAHEVLRSTWDENKIDLQEQSRVMLLNRNNRLLGVSTISMGGISSAYVDLKLVFSLALKAHASAIIVAHNHPSGNLKFSEQDKLLTQRMVDLGEALELPVLDHLVITRNGYSSMEDQGIMPIAAKGKHSFLQEEDTNKYPSSTAQNKPAFYIFNQNSNGEKPVGAVFLHGKGNGFNIVFDNKSRFVAFPPKPKPGAKPEVASGKKPKPNPPKVK